MVEQDKCSSCSLTFMTKHYIADKDRFKKNKYKNLHQDLVKVCREFARGGMYESEDAMTELYTKVSFLTKKHNYCSGGCPYAKAYLKIKNPNF
jgi:hypothetical protein